jgi:hypothetical protein
MVGTSYTVLYLKKGDITGKRYFLLLHHIELPEVLRQLMLCTLTLLFLLFRSLLPHVRSRRGGAAQKIPDRDLKAVITST